MASLRARATRKVKRLILRRTAAIRSCLRAGIVGCGAIAPEHIEGYESSGLAQVAAVSDPNTLALARMLDHWPYVRAYKDLKQMLQMERLDVVSVCTWPQSHAEIVCEAAAAGVKGVLCEKPIALQLSQIEAMLAACSKYECKLAGGHQYRFHSHYLSAARMIRDGQLGELQRVTANITSTLANNGPHLIDAVRFLLGDPRVVSVKASCERSRDEWNRGIPAEDGCSGVITFENGIECHLETGDRSRSFFSILIQGTKGSLDITPGILAVNGRDISHEKNSDNYRETQFKQFLEWVKGARATYAADAKSSAETAHIILALYESARLGRPLELPLKNKGDVIQELFPVSRIPGLRSEVGSTLLHPQTNAALRLASEGGKRLANDWFDSRPAVGISELIGVSRVILSKQMSAIDGREVKSFEKEFAAAYGAKQAVASTSGTASIHVALGALDPEPCDEIITTPLTDMGSVIPILACNCVPIFADVDESTGNLTAAAIERKITPKTKAVILVHLFGRPADIEPILELLRPRGIALIEDCAQAHYADYHGKKVGTFGDFGCFSLQQSKQMTCGDGGITLVNREDLADRAALFVDKGWNRGQGLRTHLFLGMNYRMTELQAAVARAQLRKLPRLIERRQMAAALLTEKLRQIGPMLIPPALTPGSQASWWMYPFSIDQSASGIGMEEFYQELRAEGVHVAREYVPQAVFNYTIIKEQRTYGTSRFPFSAVSYVTPEIEDFPGFLEFKKNLLYMGWSHNVSPKHVDMIARAIEKVVRALSPFTVGDGLQPVVQREPVAGQKLTVS